MNLRSSSLALSKNYLMHLLFETLSITLGLSISLGLSLSSAYNRETLLFSIYVYVLFVWCISKSAPFLSGFNPPDNCLSSSCFTAVIIEEIITQAQDV